MSSFWPGGEDRRAVPGMRTWPPWLWPLSCKPSPARLGHVIREVRLVSQQDRRRAVGDTGQGMAQVGFFAPTRCSCPCQGVIPSDEGMVGVVEQAVAESRWRCRPHPRRSSGRDCPHANTPSGAWRASRLWVIARQAAARCARGNRQARDHICPEGVHLFGDVCMCSLVIQSPRGQSLIWATVSPSKAGGRLGRGRLSWLFPVRKLHAAVVKGGRSPMPSAPSSNVPPKRDLQKLSSGHKLSHARRSAFRSSSAPDFRLIIQPGMPRPASHPDPARECRWPVHGGKSSICPGS